MPRERRCAPVRSPASPSDTRLSDVAIAASRHFVSPDRSRRQSLRMQLGANSHRCSDRAAWCNGDGCTGTDPEPVRKSGIPSAVTVRDTSTAHKRRRMCRARDRCVSSPVRRCRRPDEFLAKLKSGNLRAYFRVNDPAHGGPPEERIGNSFWSCGRPVRIPGRIAVARLHYARNAQRRSPAETSRAAS
jgi:hypothetical protein